MNYVPINVMKMMCLSFHDKRLVTILSTFFGPQTQLITGYRKKQPVQFEQPTVILEYTKFMGGGTELISTADVTGLQGGPTNGGKIILLADGSWSCEQLHPLLIR